MKKDGAEGHHVQHHRAMMKDHHEEHGTNANAYHGMIHHGEGGMVAPQSHTVEATNRVHGRPESAKSPKPVDRSSGKASSGEPTPKMRMRRGGGTRGAGDGY